MTALQRWMLWATAVFFIAAGANHFMMPDFYRAMMPSFLPAPDALHRIAGVFEILGGIGLLIPKARRVAAWGLIALLIAVFPANIQAAVSGMDIPNAPPQWVFVARLPLQAVFIAWVWAVGLRHE